MAISVYSGRPGSGKTYSVVEAVVLPSLEAGRTVVTNLPLAFGELQRRFPDALVVPFDASDVARGFLDLEERIELRGAVFVIDEAWRFWPYGKRLTDIPQHQAEFFAEHRHFVGEDGYSTEIVLVCQSLTQVMPSIRELVDTTFITSKLDKAGQKDRFRIDVYSGPQQLTRPDRTMLVRSGFSRYQSKVWDYYISHTRNASTWAAGNEDRADKRTSLFSSPTFRIGVPLALALGVVGFWSLASWMDTDRFHDEDGDAQAPVASVPAPAPGAAFSAFPVAAASAQIPSPRPPALSETWRIGAIIEPRKGYGGQAILIESNGQQRFLPVAGHCSSVRGTKWDWECVVDGERVTYYSGEDRGSRSLL